MDTSEIRYLLKRARAHRLLGQVAKCREARSIHRKFVKHYQRLLLALRRARLSPVFRQEILKKQRLGLPEEIATVIADRKVA